ncbi:hypothetical protein WICPIJ_002248 [Wickerhamomyces pijperi]|uniref:Uncharacterized protein n=1 Tax=Wickerhamomyces pijperi TaxID=599730 RepID=A0A9P8QC87_WICPI|nr:hypothetical protein WICPIJ_002248 [Wickerhamomyces pijperi]
MTTTDLQQPKPQTEVLPFQEAEIITSSTVVVECNTALLSDYDSEDDDEEEDEDYADFDQDNEEDHISFCGEEDRFIFDSDGTGESKYTFSEFVQAFGEAYDDDEEDEGDESGEEDNESTETPDSDTSFDGMVSATDGSDLLGVPQRYKNLLISSDPLVDQRSVIRIFEQDSDVFPETMQVNGDLVEDQDDDNDSEDYDYTEDGEDEDEEEELEEDEEEQEESAEISGKRKIDEIDSEDDTLEDQDPTAARKPLMMDRLIQLSQSTRPYSMIPVPTRNLKKIKTPSLEISCDPIPRDVKLPLRSAIKSYDEPILNLFINSSTGVLAESTRFATEINSLNGVGIPLPKTVNELISIPVNVSARTARSRRIKEAATGVSSAAAITKKVAYVKGFQFDHTEKRKASNGQVGFYTPDEFRKYMWKHDNPDDEAIVEESTEANEGDSLKKKEKKKLRWATELEW